MKSLKASKSRKRRKSEDFSNASSASEMTRTRRKKPSVNPEGQHEPRILSLEKIRATIDPAALIESQELGFVAYSEGRLVVPPVGHLYFEDPPGDCHIKFGHIATDDVFVIKVATGFYLNPEAGLPSGNGLILVFSKRTGRPEALLLDQGYLTDIRTAAAGAIAAKYLAPREVNAIGIIGTGAQARLQLDMLRHVTPCRRAFVWGRNRARAEKYRLDLAGSGFSIAIAESVAQLAEACNLIVTTTASRTPLLYAGHVRPGIHITAVGADGGGKQELDAEVFRKADICAVDSFPQCRDYGDSSYALKQGVLEPERLIELGTVIKNPHRGRSSNDQISIADLTGVAVQDVQIAKMVLKSLDAA
jgi:ornithine cyclodeaminase